jgi:hypothetical protein
VNPIAKAHLFAFTASTVVGALFPRALAWDYRVRTSPRGILLQWLGPVAIGWLLRRAASAIPPDAPPPPGDGSGPASG